MPLLKWVVMWPFGGPKDGSWVPAEEFRIRCEPDCDALLRISRRVCEVYSEGLGVQRLRHVVGEVRLVPSDRWPDNGDVVLSLQERPIRESGLQFVFMQVPVGFSSLASDVQADALFRAIRAATARIGSIAGLPTEALEAAAVYAKDRGLRFARTSPWKANPGRRLRARCCFDIGDDGFTRLRVQVAQRDGTSIGESEPQVTWAQTSWEYRTIIDEMKWTSTTSLVVTASDVDAVNDLLVEVPESEAEVLAQVSPAHIERPEPVYQDLHQPIPIRWATESSPG